MRYTPLKHITIMLQVFSVPIGVYSGVMLATNEALLFSVGIFVSMALSFIQAQFWWRTMEKMPEEK